MPILWSPAIDGGDNTCYFTASGPCTASGTNGTTITLTNGGACTVTAHQDGDSTYAAGPPVAWTFAVWKYALYLPIAIRP